MVKLSTSVRAAGDENLQRIQEIARMHYNEYEENNGLISEFKIFLCSTCTFVPTRSSNEIILSTYRLFSRKFSAKEAS